MKITLAGKGYIELKQVQNVNGQIIKERDYLWIGHYNPDIEEVCHGTISKTKDILLLRDVCNQILKNRKDLE